jgi:hypothetical protein
MVAALKFMKLGALLTGRSGLADAKVKIAYTIRLIKPDCVEYSE